MRFGLFMMPLHPSYRAIADCYDRDIDQLVLADKLGFDEAWLGEHFTEKWENAPSPDLLIAKALALTKRIRFGTGVTFSPCTNRSISHIGWRCSITWRAGASTGGSGLAGFRPT